MRRLATLLAIVALTACTGGCPVARGLYSAVVQRSGVPPRDELRRVQARDTAMTLALPRLRVVVLPVARMGQPPRGDSAAAARLAGRLEAEGLVASARVGAPLAVPVEPHPNELFVFWTRWRALAEVVRASPPADADVVLLVDVFGRPDLGKLAAIHAMAVTTRGESGYSAFWNNHHAFWKTRAPRTLDDATDMVVADLARRQGRVASGLAR